MKVLFWTLETGLYSTEQYVVVAMGSPPEEVAEAVAAQATMPVR